MHRHHNRELKPTTTEHSSTAMTPKVSIRKKDRFRFVTAPLVVCSATEACHTKSEGANPASARATIGREDRCMNYTYGGIGFQNLNFRTVKSHEMRLERQNASAEGENQWGVFWEGIPGCACTVGAPPPTWWSPHLHGALIMNNKKPSSAKTPRKTPDPLSADPSPAPPSPPLLDPKNDYVFKRLFAETPELLVALINAVRSHDPPVAQVQILNPLIDP